MDKHIPAATMKELRKVLFRWAVVLAAVGVVAVWATWRMSTAAGRLPAVGLSAVMPNTNEPEFEYWTCTMHPQIQQPEPGKCPICGMELVEKFAGSDEPGVRPVARSNAGNQIASAGHLHASGKEQARYRCTMPECGDQGSSDPESRCPVCGMKREQVDTGGGGEAGEFEVALGERARRLAEVETEAAQKRLLYKNIRTVGRVGYDETRHKMVSAWIGGRIDKLFADFTGMVVSQGDHLVEIYSPELLSAQEEFLQAMRAAESSRPTQTDVARSSSEQVLLAARRKLELLGVTDSQIAAIKRSGQPQTHLVVHAPLGGTVLKKQAMEGMYVKTGDPLYTIADLRHLWLLVDLYESDLPWVKPFQQVRVTTRSLPGEVFTGEIFFIDPSVNAKTRTVEVRIHVDNPAMRLKPDMWVSADIEAGLTRGGRGTVPGPDGDFACPMHPWESSDDSGVCPVCEMALVPVTQLPQYTKPTDATALLSVPRGAVMQTGERALAYVESSPGIYRGVEVILGPLAHGDDGREYYPILSGLSGGEQVVIRGNFAIDSQMQLAGRPSLFVARGMGRLVASEHATLPMAAKDKQTHCPIMGGEINPDVFIDYKGAKVYFCCWGCDDKFLAEPEKFVPKLPDAVQRQIRAADSTPSGKGVQKTCPVMGGEIDEEVFTDYRGVRVYFCCPPCIEKFEAEPQQYIPKLPEEMRKKLAATSPQEADDD